MRIFIATVLTISVLWSHAYADDGDSFVTYYGGEMDNRLGIWSMSMTEELRVFFGAPRDSGLIVSQVEHGKPGAQAGVKVGDVIVEILGRRVQYSSDIYDMTLGHEKGEHVDFVIVRKKKRIKLRATLQDEPPALVTGTGPGIYFLDLPKSRPKDQPIDPKDATIQRLYRRIGELEQRLRELEKPMPAIVTP